VRADKSEKLVKAIVDEVKAAVKDQIPEEGSRLFLELVLKNSDSADRKETRGDWGVLTLDTQVSPELPDAVRGEVVSWKGLSRRIVAAVEDLPAGGLSEPVSLSGMEHLFYVSELPEREYRPFESVKEEIEGILKPSVSENELKEYFEQNKAKYQKQSSGGTKVYHVLLRSQKRAQELIAQINDGRKTFDEVARSDDNMDQSTIREGGLIHGEVRIKAVSEAVSKTASGELFPKPVKSFVGWHIIKVGEKTEPKPVTFEEVKEEIRKRLLEEKRRDVEKGFIKELRNRAQVEKFLEIPSNPFAGMLSGLGG
jgi:parvulin-like peptidyl-prolyl isomerase